MNILIRCAKLYTQNMAITEDMMKKGLLTIGKMAEMNRISIPTLRLYDKKGLLKPRYIDPESGYRYYDIHQNARLDMIAYMKELGMSLSEIYDVFQKKDVTVIEEVLTKKSKQIHEQMEKLQERKDSVERAIMSIERYRKSPVKGTISLEYIDRRYIWGIKCSENFYEENIECYEKILSELRLALEHNKFRQTHSHNIGTSITKENFIKNKFIADKIFIFINENEKNHKNFQIIDSGMYACIYLDDYYDEIKYAEILRKYCKEHNYRIDGDYICEIMTEFNIFNCDYRNMFLRLQVPINFSK